MNEPAIPPVCTVLRAKLSAIDETKLDTARIQLALDRCSAGHSIALQADGSAHILLTGPLVLRTGVTLAVGSGVTLYASRNPRDYDLSPGSCGMVNPVGHGCKPLIEGDHVAGAGVMGDGVIDGRGGEKITGQTVSWWDLAQEAKVRNLNQSVPRILELSHADNFTLYRITLKNSPNFHVSYKHGNGFTAWGVTIYSPKTARNTDGIDPGNSTNVTITHCFIHAGDDQIAIKANDSGPSSHMTIAHNHFYTGHGISIGSETDGGVSAIRVTDLSIDGADNGIRIKSNSSRGGVVRDVVYQDVCIRDTKNPIMMDSNYSFYGQERNKLPTFTDIVLRNVTVASPGKITLEGFDAAHRLGMTFDEVSVASGSKIAVKHADIHLNQANFTPKGEDVHVEGKSGSVHAFACEAKFVPMPAVK